jgi:hypothetical protein
LQACRQTRLGMTRDALQPPSPEYSVEREGYRAYLILLCSTHLTSSLQRIPYLRTRLHENLHSLLGAFLVVVGMKPDTRNLWRHG